MIVKNIVRRTCPSFIRMSFFSAHSRLKRILRPGVSLASRVGNPECQDLGLYWSPEFAQALETWGEDNAWREIQFLVAGCQGKILDIACGTGKVLEILGKFSGLDSYGCDISDLLIRKAIDRGIPGDHLAVCDAIRMGYKDNCFDYAYSIGSLEHFTENQIAQFVFECYRVTRASSFHMIPIDRNGRDAGWIKTAQSYYNNSAQWWLSKFKICYETVYVIDSTWQDKISVGKWFVCVKGKRYNADR